MEDDLFSEGIQFLRMSSQLVVGGGLELENDGALIAYKNGDSLLYPPSLWQGVSYGGEAEFWTAESQLYGKQ